ncbi:MAG: protein-export chaperone SecB [Bacteroidota bacterium]
MEDNTQTIAIEQRGLKFHSFEAYKIIFNRGTTAKDGKFNITVGNNTLYPNPENTNLFHCQFNITINSLDVSNPLDLIVEAIGVFEIIGELDIEFSDKLKSINAPAITYPYIRAFIYNLTISVGMNPIVIPVMDFASKTIEMLNEKKNNEAKEIKS